MLTVEIREGVRACCNGSSNSLADAISDSLLDWTRGNRISAMRIVQEIIQAIDYDCDANFGKYRILALAADRITQRENERLRAQREEDEKQAEEKQRKEKERLKREAEIAERQAEERAAQDAEKAQKKEYERRELIARKAASDAGNAVAQRGGDAEEANAEMMKAYRDAAQKLGIDLKGQV